MGGEAGRSITGGETLTKKGVPWNHPEGRGRQTLKCPSLDLTLEPCASRAPDFAVTGQRQATAGVKGPLGEEADMAEITRQQTRL